MARDDDKYDDKHHDPRDEQARADAAPGQETRAWPEDELYTEDGDLNAAFLEAVREALQASDRDRLLETAGGLHESELGDLLEALDPEERHAFVLLLGDDFDFSALTEVDEAIRLAIIEDLPNDKIAQAIGALDSDDAVYILEDLEPEDQDDILSKLAFTDRIRLRRSLDYPESTAGRRMQTEFVAVPPFWTVGQTIDYLRDDEDLPDSFSQVFVVDPTFKLLGVVDLDKILRTRRAVRIDAIMRETHHPIPAEMDQEEAAQLFEQYDLLSAAVVDDNGRLVGVLTIDDVVDVIQEEAEEDLRRMRGVGDEELSDSIAAISRSRVPWLFINVFTAFLAAGVISLFDATIQEIVALAILMPIVAGLGGNAGAQTMTVTVRALATRDLGMHNAGRIIRRESVVGLINGMLFGLLIGLMAGAWFQSFDIGAVIASAMLINMIVAALAGIAVPLVLDRCGADPAVASAVFVTTTTDIIGFFAFLGIATWWFGLPVG